MVIEWGWSVLCPMMRWRCGRWCGCGFTVVSLVQVIIEHGALIAGILSKDTLGNKTGSLMHVIAAEFGYDIARDFYGNIQKVVNNFLMIEGHSIGIGDTIADTDTYNDIQRTIRQAKVGMGGERNGGRGH